MYGKTVDDRKVINTSGDQPLPAGYTEITAAEYNTLMVARSEAVRAMKVELAANAAQYAQAMTVAQAALGAWLKAQGAPAEAVDALYPPVKEGSDDQVI